MKSEIRSIVRKARKDKEVLATMLFGSYVREEQFSDIDICLVLQPDHYQKLKLSKKKLVYMKDVSNNIDIQIFQQLPLYIQARIIKEGKVLFSKSDTLYDLVFQTLKEYEDYKKIYHSYLARIAHGS